MLGKHDGQEEEEVVKKPVKVYVRRLRRALDEGLLYGRVATGFDAPRGPADSGLANKWCHQSPRRRHCGVRRERNIVCAQGERAQRKLSGVARDEIEISDSSTHFLIEQGEARANAKQMAAAY